MKGSRAARRWSRMQADFLESVLAHKNDDSRKIREVSKSRLHSTPKEGSDPSL